MLHVGFETGNGTDMNSAVAFYCFCTVLKMAIAVIHLGVTIRPLSNLYMDLRGVVYIQVINVTRNIRVTFLTT